MKIWHEVWDYIKMIIIVVAIVLVINNVVRRPDRPVECVYVGNPPLETRVGYGRGPK